jgi:hypothetical protein
VDPRCDYHTAPPGVACAVKISDADLALIPEEIRERYVGNTLWQCARCDALWIDPFRWIGKIGSTDGPRAFWRRGETKAK